MAIEKDLLDQLLAGRDPKDVFNLDSKRLVDQGPEGVKTAQKFIHDWKVNPPQSCSGCHR